MARDGTFDILWGGYPFFVRFSPSGNARVFFFAGRARNKLVRARKQFFHLQGQNCLSQLLGQIFFLNFQGEFFPLTLSCCETYEHCCTPRQLLWLAG